MQQASPTSLVACVLAFITVLLFVVSRAVFNAFFHPLRKFPGSKLWSTSFLFRHVSAMRGRLDWSLKSQHEKYGRVVRFSPEELSFISEQAWKDIHSHKDGHMIKDPQTYKSLKIGPDAALSIMSADQERHPKIRKQLAHAFSDKAIRDQETSIKSYVDLLIEKLRGVALTGTSTDMVRWYNFTTFDLTGDLTIGKSFDCLNGSEYHSWISGIFESIKIGTFIRAMTTYTDVDRLMRLLASPSLKAARFKHEQHVRQHAQERIDRGIMEDRKDFLSYILQNGSDKDGVADKEVVANCGFLILAGSETTATTLSGLTYYLLRNPEALQKVTNEVRNSFANEAEITFINTARLSYMVACINEALRLYPPGAGGAPRRTPKGSMTKIDGYEVPGWTMVSVHALTATHSALNFHLPSAFIPERWLPSSTADSTSPFYKDHRGASQPFGLGPRNCLGKNLAYSEMRVILARVLWNFDLQLCEESADWEKQNTYMLWEKKPLVCRLWDMR